MNHARHGNPLTCYPTKFLCTKSGEKRDEIYLRSMVRVVKKQTGASRQVRGEQKKAQLKKGEEEYRRNRGKHYAKEGWEGRRTL